jgi:ribosomal protein S18 acetylase RimI-like enzyme
MEAVAARFSDLELYQSEEDLEWARRVGIVGASKGILLGNGCDLSRFDPSVVPAARQRALREELGLASGAVVVGAVGRLVAEKGYREFFEAARRIRAGRPEVRFVAVGNVEPDKWDAISEDEIDRARSDVVFTGWREDVRDLMAIMDVFVLASWREGLPRSAVEAAAMGKPLVLTDIRGCREVARHGIEGLLVPARRPEPLAAAIDRLIADPGLRERMGAAARARAVDRFDEAGVLQTIINRYARLLPEVARAEAAGEFRVRAGRRDDATALARLHQEIPYAFMGRLGPGFLRRFYGALLSDRNAVVLVAENGGGPVGFVSAVPSSKAFNRRFYLRHGIGAIASAAPRLLRPAILRGALETLRYTAGGDDLPDAELISIAVAPEWRARGVGKSLTEHVVRALAGRGVREMKVMVRAENDPANRFYASRGFREANTIQVHGGKPSRVWVTSCRS